MAMMNPELAALLSQGQTAPPSVAGSPVVSAIQKMMGAGGSAPSMPQQMAQAAPQGNMPMPQSTTPNPVSTEEELAMAQKMMGGGEPRGANLKDRITGKGEGYNYSDNKAATPADKRHLQQYGGDADTEEFAMRYGDGSGRKLDNGANLRDRVRR